MATANFCPQCRTPRVGALRYCPSCAFDYEQGSATSSPPAAIATASGSRRGWAVLGGVIFAAIVAAAAFVSLGSGLLSSAPPRHEVAGTFSLMVVSAPWKAGDACFGSGGYSDIRSGTNVTLRDGDGKIVGTTTLGLGTAHTVPDLAATLTCDFAFALESVPEVPFYSIEVSHRGTLTYGLDQMKARGWTVSLSLGP